MYVLLADSGKRMLRIQNLPDHAVFKSGERVWLKLRYLLGGKNPLFLELNKADPVLTPTVWQDKDTNKTRAVPANTEVELLGVAYNIMIEFYHPDGTPTRSSSSPTFDLLCCKAAVEKEREQCVELLQSIANQVGQSQSNADDDLAQIRRAVVDDCVRALQTRRES